MWFIFHKEHQHKKQEARAISAEIQSHRSGEKHFLIEQVLQVTCIKFKDLTWLISSRSGNHSQTTQINKCPNTELFLVLIFPHSEWIRRDTSYLSVFTPNAEKYGPEITPYLDTFHTVTFTQSIDLWLLLYFSWWWYQPFIKVTVNWYWFRWVQQVYQIFWLVQLAEALEDKILVTKKVFV